MASKGRNGDSMLVHMTPGEVAGLHALALKHGGELTINPDTGLPEANFLKSLLPMLAGAALNFFVPGLGAAVGGAFGLGAAAGTGIAVGGLTTLATGSLSRGLMAGMGAYGGAGLSEGFMGAGVGAAQQGAMESLSADQIASEMANTELTKQGVLNQAAADATKSALADPGSTFSAGLKSAAANPLDFAKTNFKPLAAAAAPIMADMMVPTTTKMPAATDTGYIRQKVYDPGTQTYRSLTPVKANEWKDRSFSDIYRGYNGGGIVALAAGGTGQTVADLYADLGRTPDKEGQAFWESSFGTGPVTEAQKASFMQSANSVIGAETKSALEDAYARNDVGAINQLIADNRITAQNIGDTWKGFDTSGITGLQLYTPPTATATATDTSGITTLNNNTNNAATNNTAGTNLAAFSNDYTGANINDYIANNKLDAAGITAAAKQFNVDPAQITAAQNAQNIVTNVYRNVLGRDPDPAGLSWWTNQIMNGDRTGAEMYEEFKKSAQSILGARGEKELFKEMSLDEAVKDFGGYQSADKRTIADEWVRNTLGREVTDADRQTQWYKDASNSAVMNTVGKAEDIYNKFKNFAYENAGNTVKQKIAEAKATLSKNGLTEADVLRQTGKTIAELIGSGMNLENDLFKASQLRKPGDKAGFDFNTITKAKPVINNTFDSSTVVDRKVTNPYGNATNPGDLTYNTDGTVTVQPNIPYRPYGGFSGMGEVRDAYTQGGGSLGYTPYAPKTAAEHAVLYNNLTGDSEAAYNYLMGKGGAKYPTKSRVGEIAQPYREATLGYPTSTNKAYNYDAATGKMVRNPDYVATGRDDKGNVNYTMSLNEMKKYLTTNPLTGQALFEWAQENGVSAQDVADATGRKLSEVYAEFRAAKKVADAKIGTGVGASGTYDIGGGGDGPTGPSGNTGNTISGFNPAAPNPSIAESFGNAPGSTDGNTGSTTGTEGGAVASANGGLLPRGYAVGGGLGSLGSYSDGGRLLKGPGDGVSDSIPATIGAKQQPARLADGEFVIPARIVSELGNGSTDAGAKKLYAMMDRVQRARGKTTGKNKVAANSRADKYLPA
jgi:hypothetical protein